MVIGLLVITAIPTITGVGQAVSAQKKQNAAAREQEKFHLAAIFPPGEEAGFCVLTNGRLALDLPGEQVMGHKFCGYYFMYPGQEQHLCLVSTISDDPPMLNWIYVNRDTRAVEHGARKDTIGHVIGPWGWNSDGTLLTLKGSDEDFIAKWEDHGGVQYWGVYWDPEHEIPAEEGKPVRLGRKPLLGVESKEHDRAVAESAEDGSSSSPEDKQRPRQGKKTTRKPTKRSGKGSRSSLSLDRLPVGDVDNVADNAVGSVTNTLGSVANNTVGQQSGGSGKSDTLRLRLDLNLDIEITLKAKIHGDLELALLN